MKITDFQQLFDYMYWANRQMWQCVAGMNTSQHRENLDYSIGSVYLQLVHIVSIENLWINYLWHGEVEFLNEVNLPTMGHIRVEWDALEEEFRDYLSTLTDDDLDTLIVAPFFNLPPLTLRDILLQIVNHATDHRAQILAGVHKLGGATVPQDYLRYLKQMQVA